jgi:hypothetical protein
MIEDSLRGNISWASAHLFGGDFYYNKFKQNQLSVPELRIICESYLHHRKCMQMLRGYWDFRMKRRDRHMIKLLNELISELKGVMYGPSSKSGFQEQLKELGVAV